jgi:2-polyprenyl-3-methyl-5-hydroxy-6-metoxy-1,4-benzoquinol methylase
MDAAEFFDAEYASKSRYWWSDKDPYALDADSYPTSLLTQLTLRHIEGRPPGKMLDLGAGEGADSIRLALRGYSVDAVEISKMGVRKILMFAEEAGVNINVKQADIVNYEPEGQYDLVICNGVLQYIDDKKSVVERMQTATRSGGLHVISLWSTYTAVPECHQVVPVHCDNEDGTIKNCIELTKELLSRRNKPELTFGNARSQP